MYVVIEFVHIVHNYYSNQYDMFSNDQGDMHPSVLALHGTGSNCCYESPKYGTTATTRNDQIDNQLDLVSVSSCVVCWEKGRKEICEIVRPSEE